eukprot:TRINITY_DN7505_c0_g1_i1.p3 TRINITY_DN7505_c0_g1~~TRINITY_DN7505_c0_g1_i1.p3  ORF type:complete len:173 (+),score=18.68 TRINITY_DN7505_c0_g1_i1:1302-1820(+)
MRFAETRHEKAYVNQFQHEFATLCNSVLVEVSRSIKVSADCGGELRRLAPGTVQLTCPADLTIFLSLPADRVNKTLERVVLRKPYLPQVPDPQHHHNGTKKYDLDAVAALHAQAIKTPNDTISRHLKRLGWSLDVVVQTYHKVTVTLKEHVVSPVSLYSRGLQLLDAELHAA